MRIPKSVSEAMRKTTANLEYKKSEPDSMTERKRWKPAISVSVYPKLVPRTLKLLQFFLVKASKIGAIPKAYGVIYHLEIKRRSFRFKISEESNFDWTPVYHRGRVSTGKLTISIDPLFSDNYPNRLSPQGKVWSDEPGCPLESKLDEIVATIPKMLAALLAEEAKQEEKRAREREERRKWRIEQDKRDSAKSNWRAIHAASRNWWRANQLREFLSDARTHADEKDENFQTWVRMCEIVISNLDPLIGGARPWENIVRASEGRMERTYIRVNKHRHYDWEIVAIDSADCPGGANPSL